MCKIKKKSDNQYYLDTQCQPAMYYMEDEAYRIQKERDGEKVGIVE